MITIICTKCRTMLELDDAFAGGACRCQHCGAIQKVPKPRHAPAAVRQPAAQEADPHTPSAGTGSGLDDLAEIVASSGLSGQRLRRPGSGTKADDQPPPDWRARTRALLHDRRSLITLSAFVATLLVMSVLLWSIWPTRRGPAADDPGTAPAFVGLSLDEPSVIFILDRGAATRASLSHLKEATLRSVHTLGPQRRFQILFWSAGDEVIALPAESPVLATSDYIAAADRDIDEVFATGQTVVGPALEHAMGHDPAVIVLATGKGWSLDDDFVDTVMNIRGDSNARIHTFAIGGAAGSDALRRIAEETGGEYREVSAAELTHHDP